MWNEEFKSTPTHDECLTILEKAEEQTVFGLIFDVLTRANCNIGQKVLYEGIGQQQYIANKNCLLNKGVTWLATKGNEINMDYLVIKGQTVGAFYPKPELRMPGDIDFLVEDTSKVKLVFPDITIPKIKIYESVFNYQGIIYELHVNLRTFFKKKHQTIWNELVQQEWANRNYVNLDGILVRTLSPTLYAVYIFLHLFFHFIREGVSLRQFCDWAMVLHHYREEINSSELHDIINALDMEKPYKAFGAILVNKIGLPEEELTYKLCERDNHWAGKIEVDIFKSGNFGKLHHVATQRITYKLETFMVALRNSFKYFELCPSEVGGLIPRLLKQNVNHRF